MAQSLRSSDRTEGSRLPERSRPVTDLDRPEAQHLAPDMVLDELAVHGAARLRSLDSPQIIVLGMIAGGFITVGALFSILLADGATNPGTIRLLEGLGFSAGFFFVILSGAALFTEANVAMPATLLGRSDVAHWRVVRFWGLAWLGNFAGALVVGWAITAAQRYSPGLYELLDEVVASKLSYRTEGGADEWFRIVLSGVLANWLVGMAAFFATMGRTIVGKYIPVFLAVTAFVAANFQHSPANMAFFSLAEWHGSGPGWIAALGWSIIPAGIGNIIGGTFLVVLPLRYALRMAPESAG